MNWRSAMLAMVMICILLTLVQLNLRHPEKQAIRWLTAFVLAGVITAIPMVIGFAGAYDRWPDLTFLPTQLSPLFGPLLFLHARALMEGGPAGRWLWLLLPGAVFWLYQVWAFLFLGGYENKWAFNDSFHEPYIVPLVYAVGLSLAVWALAMIWRMRGRYLLWLVDHRSDDDLFDPAWLTHFLMIGIPLVVVWAAENLLGQYFGFSYYDRFWADFLGLFLLFVIAMEALVRIRQSFPKMRVHEEAEAAALEANEQATDVRDWAVEGQQLQLAVRKHLWHLEAGISLQELARRMGTNQAYLSKSLNQGLGMTFSHFINQQRIEHARQLIQQGEHSMLDVALGSGFGSKASFNRAFKKHAGETPSQFLASINA